MSWLNRRVEIWKLCKLEREKYKEMIKVGCYASNTGDIEMYCKSLELEREVNEIRARIAILMGNERIKKMGDNDD